MTFAGTGGVVRLAPLLFGQQTELELAYIPYRGSTQAHPDLMAGRVDIMFDTVPAALPHIQSGALRRWRPPGRSARRSCRTCRRSARPACRASRPDLGHGDRPGQAAGAVLAKLNADCVAALKRPEVMEKHRVLGAEVVTSTPAEIRAFTESELKKWGEAARKAGIVPQ